MKTRFHYYLSSKQWISAFAILTAGLLLAAPRALAAGQNLFVSDGDATIYKITPTGTVTTFASGLNLPAQLAFDTASNLYEADQGGNLVRKITPTGTKSTFASGLSSPVGLAFDTKGNLYVANQNSGDIIKITSGGTKTTFASGLSAPAGLAFDTASNLYVANTANNEITKITPAAVETTFASNLGQPNGLAFDSAGNLYVADVFSDSINIISPSGTVTTFASNLNAPNDVTFDNAGNLFDAEATVVNEFTPPSGTPTAFVTLPGGKMPAFLAFEPVPVSPVLTITSSKNQVIISWPASDTGYTLQTNSNLATTNWGNYTGKVVNNTVTNVPSPTKMFFRLK